MKEINTAQDALDNLKKQTIGFFKFYDVIHFVLNDDEGYLHCINISQLGAIQELHIESNQGRYVKIPEQYESFWHLLQEPNNYFNWYKQNF
jgi:hypothetical protein